MAFTAPTADDLQARFPAFAAVADAIVTTALNEAALMVDDTWVSQADFTLGRLLYAAHILTLDGHGTGTEAEMAAAGTLGFQTMQSGALRLTRFSKTEGGAGDQPLTQTQYGRRFLEVQRRNVAGPITASATL